ncbi:MAG: Coenzyme F420 hydrogenase/dehydrogenase, beta subunit C-terminal domain [Bacillota bacterium]
MPGQEQLKSSVIEKDLCSGCGMCVGMCPYIKTMRDRVRVIHPCGLNDGKCFKACPKAMLDVGQLDGLVFGASRQDQALGIYRSVYFARSAGNKAAGAQYGGVASALMAFAIEEGLIDGSVMAGGTALDPKPVLAKTGREIMSCAGSKYTAVPTLAAFNEAVRCGAGRLGLVGRPCQVEAVRKMQYGNHMDSHINREKAVGLTLGLFCFWSLTPGFYDYLAEKAGGEEIIKVDIPLEGLTVTTPKGAAIRPVDEIRQYIKNTCNYCIDCTSEWADLSVGSTEYDPQWNTLLVRTTSGEALVNRALEKGAIEVKPYPVERLPILRKAALNKKVRILSAPGQAGPDYLKVPGRYIAEMKKQWEVLQ